MSGWSPKEAIAMERRHVLEGEKRIVQQLALVAKLDSGDNEQLAKDAVALLNLQREILKFSRTRLQELEGQFGREPSTN